MEKAAATRFQGRRRELAPGARSTLVVLGALLCTSAWSQVAGPESQLAAPRNGQQPLRVQVETSTLPRLDAQDAGFQAPRVDVSLFPGDARGLGAVVGMSGFSPQQPRQPGLAPQRPSFDVGLRWSQRLDGQARLDVTAWRRMAVAEDAYSLLQARQPVYGARLEMNLKPARPSILGLDAGFVGLQLESGARISVKRKDGRPMVYYRTTF